MNFKRIRLAIAVSCVVLLAACGGGNGSLASDSDVRADAPEAGPTSFISFVRLTGKSLQNVSGYSYAIEPKAGAASGAIHVAYALSALGREGYVSADLSSVTLPVFGLYAGRKNRVDVELRFVDGSTQPIGIDIATPAYADPNHVYDSPTILTRRAAGDALGFSYFLVKSTLSGPVVIDTDGEVRWVAPAPSHAGASKFTDNRFIVGAPDSVRYESLGLDGRSRTGTLLAQDFSAFHHNLDAGKTGMLGEFDTVESGVKNLESVVAEFDEAGNVLAQWNLAALLAAHMREQGDDPGPFIRAGVDWFHNNAATYDPEDDSVLVSSRENFVVKIDYRTGKVLWIFGDPTKYWYTFPSLRAKALHLQLGGLYPLGQHGTSITRDGLLMLFNNGAPSFNQPAGAPIGESRPYSAVSAYRIDATAMTAREEWVFDHDKALLSDICSSAQEAPSGSVLISFATVGDRRKARIVGLGRDRRVLLDIEYLSVQPCSTAWNAEVIPFESLHFE